MSKTHFEYLINASDLLVWPYLLGIVKFGIFAVQIAAYNGHKRIHSLKFKITTADGLITHAYGPVVGFTTQLRAIFCSYYGHSTQQRCFDQWALIFYARCTGYNRRSFLDIAFAKAYLTATELA